jgi:hypothetical protein
MKSETHQWTSFFSAYNIIVNMNTREIKEVFDEVYKVESTVIFACGRSRRNGRVCDSRVEPGARHGSVPIGRRPITRRRGAR